MRFLLALVAATAFAQTPSQRCLEYGPTSVILTGRIQVRDYPGPPHYESIQNGDSRETAWILRLPNSICMDGTGDDVDRAESDINEIQLVIVNDADGKRYAPLIGKNVQVSGTLFHADTIHHQTRVLMVVQLVELQTNRATK